MHIKVFGPGCARCAQTEQLVKEVAAAKDNGITVEKVNDLQQMMSMGIMSTPAVAIDGVVVCAGRVPDKQEIAAWIEAAPPSPAPAAKSCGCCCGK